MSIPTTNLYDFIYQVLKNKACMCYFMPWGAKGIENIVDYEEYNKSDMVTNFQNNLTASKIYPGNILNTTLEVKKLQPWVICHDQEPLNFDFYKDESIDKNTIHWDSLLFEKQYKAYSNIENRNLRWRRPTTYTDKWVLIHSEKNGSNLQRYINSDLFIPAFYWSHGMIARDWYRFAEYDEKLNNKCWEKDFLIYCRDTSGSRQYRKTFLDIIPENLKLKCQFNSIASQPASSDHSAVYDALDHTKTRISVILETVFDDRIHLTEKTLRAIACGHPFYLFNGPGCLEYLRSYGFKTFDKYIDESYDLEHNSTRRMDKIIKSMQQFSDASDKENITKELHKIAEFNKQHFFSKDFHNRLVNELRCNVHSAIDQVNLDTKFILKDMTFQKTHSVDFSQREKYRNDPSRKHLLLCLRHLRKGGTLEDYVPPDLD